MTDPTCPHCGVAIGEHEANACLNAWVATSLFGWVDTWVAHERSGGVPKVYANLPERQRDYVAIECPPYSTSISAAWEVVEEMRRKAPPDAWFCVWNAWETNRWVAGYMEYDMDGDVMWTDESADALAAPLAICRAAVLAATGENT